MILLRRRAVGALVALALMPPAGCDADWWAGCPEPDQAVVDKIMAGARTDFSPTLPDGEPGVEVSHVELNDAVMAELPDQQQRFGATQLVMLHITTVFGGADASDSISGVHGVSGFYLDSRGEVIGPMDWLDAELFGLDLPTDPDWSSWAEDTMFATEAYDCVDPNAR